MNGFSMFLERQNLFSTVSFKEQTTIQLPDEETLPFSSIRHRSKRVIQVPFRISIPLAHLESFPNCVSITIPSVSFSLL